MLIANIKTKNKVKLSELNNVELLKLILKFYDDNKFQDVINLGNNINLETEDQYWIYYLRGLSHLKLKNFDKAINDLRQSLQIRPNSSLCFFQLGIAFHHKKDFENAKINYKNAIHNKENYFEAILNLGKLYKDFGNYKSSKECLDRALKINPNSSSAYNYLGALAEARNDFTNAKRYYHKSIILDKANYQPLYNLSLVQLYENRYEIGWKNFESRWKIHYYYDRMLHSNQPLWNPKIGNNCHLTIWPEQGMGDFILYSRFLSNLTFPSKNIVVIIYDKLKPIYDRTFPHINFVTELDTGTIDYHAPIGDLAKFYVKSFQDVKARSDVYLSVDKLRSEQIKQSLPNGKKICGISWISKNDNIGKNKSMTLEDMKDLLMLPDVTFVDLQYTDTSEERADFKQKYGVDIIKLEEIDNFNDIDGLASLIDACDCVVSVSNTTAHIAGAIGKETYLMLPQGKGRLWYWSKEKQQSIWYKSIKIIEQNKIGHWGNVIQQIKDELKGEIICI